MTTVQQPTVTWRQATAADSAAVAAVNIRSWQESFPDRPLQGDDLSVERRSAMFRSRFGTAFYRMYVVEERGAGVVGFVDVGRPRHANPPCDAELYAIYLLKAYQGRGLGRRLFELACEAVVAQGLRSMFLIALQDNPHRTFYECLGGRVLATRADGDVPGQDAHVIYGFDLRRRPQLP